MSWNTRFRRQILQLAVAAGVCGLLLSPAAASGVLFEDNFDSYAGNDDAEVTAAGWSINSEGAALEGVGGPHGLGANWTIRNSEFKGRGNPVTRDGSPSTGWFMISDSDGADSKDLPGGQSSYNLETPSFSTAGSSDNPWLHMSVSANLNNNGLAVFIVESKVGAGAWTERYATLANGRARVGLPDDNVEDDHNGQINGIVDYFPDHTNVGGFTGGLDVDLGAESANQADVKVRIRQYEPNDDWWIAIDDVKVDHVAPPTTGSTIAFSEDFNDLSGAVLGQAGYTGSMTVLNVTDGGAGGDEQWASVDRAGANVLIDTPAYRPGKDVDEHRLVDRLGHNDPSPGGPDDGFKLPFAFSQGYIATALLGAPFESQLATPVRDFTDATEVILEYTEEGYRADFKATVTVRQDQDGDGADAHDAVLATLMDQTLGNNNAEGGEASRFPSEEPHFANRVFSVPEAVGLDKVWFDWEYGSDLSNQEGDNSVWWAIDNIVVSYNEAIIDDHTRNADFDHSGFVNGDDFLIWQGGFGGAGDHEGGDANDDGVVNGDDFLIWQSQFGGPFPPPGGGSVVPEPSTVSLALLLVGMAFASLRKRRR